MIRVWLRDLALGARFAVGGGREGWARTILTAVGVGVGVAMLLLAAAVPSALQARDARGNARTPQYAGGPVRPGAHTVMVAGANTHFRGVTVAGQLVRADGADPVLPPGLSRLPGPGEMAVSPALRALLAEPGSGLLRQRLHYRDTATITRAGLMGPADIYYYAALAPHTPPADRASRTAGFGLVQKSTPLDPMLVMLVLVAVMALLMPVGVFIGTAVRFGGERRDRRLAALRLVGADRPMVCRIAAGESAFGSVLGLLIGGAIFTAGRHLAGSLTVDGLSAYASDLTPVGWLTALIVVAVPVSAIVVTLLALRGVAIEPLGVVRNAVAKRRRLWWRLAMPVVGALAFVPLFGTNGVHGTMGEIQIGGGVALLLIGLTALLPWLVEAVVRRMGGAGPLTWQLASRRLQLAPGVAARMVSGITIAVAGAIALMTLLTSTAHSYTKDTGQDTHRAQVTAYMDAVDGVTPNGVIDALRRTPGVAHVQGATEASAVTPASLATARAAYARHRDADVFYQLPEEPVMVADCATLESLSTARDCRPGSVYLVGADNASGFTVRPGTTLDLGLPEGNPPKVGPARLWTVPRDARTAGSAPDAMGATHEGVLATPEALPLSLLAVPHLDVEISLKPGFPDAIDQVRTTATRFDATDPTLTLTSETFTSQFATIRHGILAGAVLVLLIIGASLLVSMLEQLRDRRQLLAVLVAFGTRRATLGVSVLWQTAVPVVLGLALAVGGGLGLGALLRGIQRSPVGFDWSGIAQLTGFAAAVVLAVTLAGLPPLWRMMRPDGLRTE